LAPREDPRLRRGLGRGPLDDPRGDRRGRSRSGDQCRAVRPVRVAAGGVVRREGERRTPEPVRRPRREGGRDRPGADAGSSLMAVAEENPLLEGLRLKRRPEPCTLVIFGASGDLTQRKLMPALYSLAYRRLLPEAFAVVGAARSEESDEDFRDRMKDAVQQHSRDDFKQDVWERLIIEKPCGRDLQSARQLNAQIQEYFTEGEVYRIDHYLGKETVQNMLALRFANGIFEPIWNRQFIDHIQITVAESIGIE